VGRISLDLWGLLDHLYFDEESLRESEPDPWDAPTHPARSARHYYYWTSVHRAKGVATTVLGVACLEAYINEIIQLEPRLSKETRDNLRHLRIRDKYQAFIGHFGSAKPSRNEEPFRSFDLLVKLRNALVHFSGGTPENSCDWWGPNIGELLKGSESRQSANHSIKYPDSIVDSQYPAWVRSVASQLLTATNTVILDKSLCLDPNLSSSENAFKWDARTE
jgi:hypothetical protein